eukprot:8547721-Ditylum_brightwellii.AAC.1
MKNKISYCSQKQLVNFNNYAASCYDCIILNLANLIRQKKGLHRSIVFVHASTLEEARFKLKTALRVSEDFYQHCEVFPIYCTGQGRQTNSFYNDNTTPEELICLMQEDAQLWSDLLWPTVMQSARPGPALVVNQSNNKTDTEIQYKKLYTLHETLGHLKAP